MKRWGGLWGFFLIMGLLVSFPCLALDAKGAPQQIRYTGERYPDPTVSPLSVGVREPPKQEEGPVQLPPLEVQGVMWGELQPRAIVNNRVVGKGDFLEGVEILEVSQKGIRIFFKGKSYFLRPGGMVEER